MIIDSEVKSILHYENDDMYADLLMRCGIYAVYARAYDGDLEVSEEFSQLSKAAALYEYILAHHKHSPPGAELNKFISGLLLDGRYA